jgi:hypothetical protein
MAPVHAEPAPPTADVPRLASIALPLPANATASDAERDAEEDACPEEERAPPPPVCTLRFPVLPQGAEGRDGLRVLEQETKPDGSGARLVMVDPGRGVTVGVMLSSAPPPSSCSSAAVAAAAAAAAAAVSAAAPAAEKRPEPEQRAEKQRAAHPFSRADLVSARPALQPLARPSRELELAAGWIDRALSGWAGSSVQLVQYAQMAAAAEADDGAPAAAGAGEALLAAKESGGGGGGGGGAGGGGGGTRREDHLHVFLHHEGVRVDVHLCKTTREGGRTGRKGNGGAAIGGAIGGSDSDGDAMAAAAGGVTAVSLAGPGGGRSPAALQRGGAGAAAAPKVPLLTPPPPAVLRAFATTLLSAQLLLAPSADGDRSGAAAGCGDGYEVSAAEHTAYAGWFLARQQREQQRRQRRREEAVQAEGGRAPSPQQRAAEPDAAERLRREVRASAAGRRARAHFRAALHAERHCAAAAAAAASPEDGNGDTPPSPPPPPLPQCMPVAELRRLANTAGIVFAAAGLGADAVAAFQLAAQRDPAHPTTRYNLACALAEQGTAAPSAAGVRQRESWGAGRWAEELAARRAEVLGELRAAWDARAVLLQRQEHAMLEGGGGGGGGGRGGGGGPQDGASSARLLRVPELPNPLEDECFRAFWGDPELQQLAELFVEESV